VSEQQPSGALLSVVIPVLDEADSLPVLRERLREALAGGDIETELVFVDDGSTDGSAELIARWTHTEPGIVLVRLSRNFGMEVAMSAGVDHAEGDYLVLMHADLQDPPELIPEMLEKARAGADVVYARRIGSDESRTKRVLATAFYGLMHRLARVPYQGQAGDFRLMSRRVVDTIRAMPERRRFLRGMVAWVGFEQVPIDYRRAGRRSGRGASYPDLIRLAGEAFASFSDVPLGLATFFGLVVAILSAAGALVLALLAAVGLVTASISIWILVTLMFLGGVQLISVGVLGRYVARMHDQTLQRPLYLVNRVIASPLDTAPPGQGAGTGGTSSRSR
jgi:polyisoprenyl-phosphate glycosyltransferase